MRSTGGMIVTYLPTMASDRVATMSEHNPARRLLAREPGLRLVFPPGADVVSELALLMAVHGLTWAHAVQIAIDTTATTSPIDLSMTAMLEWVVGATKPEDRMAVLEQLALRFGRLHLPSLSVTDAASFRAALVPYLRRALIEA